jgi:hypothetical protein
VKIFISHSSQDKWIARRVEQDLAALGATTFLDEKDIATGDSIDDSIQDHLKECDEVLMLLSPSALKSHWVLLEVGGAKALGLRLIPILLHVGPNELPAPLGKGLARDLNEIDKYYEEVKQRIAGSDAAGPPVRARPRARASTRTPVRVRQRPQRQRRQRRFKKGDKVRIPNQPQPDFLIEDGVIDWAPGMTQHAGKAAIVTFADTDRTVHLDVDDGVFWWAMDWLEPVE